MLAHPYMILIYTYIYMLVIVVSMDLKKGLLKSLILMILTILCVYGLNEKMWFHFEQNLLCN